MPILSCSNLSKSYIVDTVFKDISFNVEDGDKIGILGLNGTGKTTLLNILSGELERDSGDVYVQKDLKIGYLKQHVSIHSNKSIFDECLEEFSYLIQMEADLRDLEYKISLLGSNGESSRLNDLMAQYGHLSEEFSALNGYGYKSEIKGVLKGLGFGDEDLDKKVDILSGGQKSRIYLAKLLLNKPKLLLLDEPTNHLDIDAISWLEKFLKDYKGSALIISHDRYFLDNVANRIFYMENGGLNIYNCNYSRFMIQRKIDLDLLKKQYEDQQKEVKRQEEIISRFMNYGGARYIKQAQSRQKLLDKMKVIDKQKEAKKTKIRFTPSIKSGNDVLRVENVSKSFGDLDLLKDINFNIYRGERVGLIGANGIGKTTLFKIILGQIAKDGGRIYLGTHVYPGYFDQEMDKLNLENTVIDEIWDDNPSLDHFQIRSALGQFLFVGDDIFKEIKDLSGGEKGRLALLKLMLSKSNFLLMDEPTNHLDIDSKEVLEDALLDYEGTVFVISHDRYFLNRVSNKIIELTEDGIKEYMGNYNYYLEKKNEVIYEDEEESSKTKTQIKLEKKKEKEALIEDRNRRKKINALENEISSLETELESVDKDLSNPQIYETLERVVELSKKREEIEERLNRLYAMWMEYTES
ncbi:ABC-F family ATP-binding cassette domain-containing protein [Tissierella creatinini]|nr:ABC-F family ATP-binding cassette domain-containing protein [Tissierella creatinini]TJX66351.1 ABC-F family ATP-binding cassette domain-containing protein [Soehngenia saccharolytica]